MSCGVPRAEGRGVVVEWSRVEYCAVGCYAVECSIVLWSAVLWSRVRCGANRCFRKMLQEWSGMKRI